jgi:hypothetical protein
LIAIEPLSYREILALVLEGRFPEARVRAVAPHELDQEVESCAPCVVVCDRVTPKVRATALSWVHVLPPELRDAVVCVGLRHHARIKDAGIEDLLAVLDSTQALNSKTPVPSSRRSPFGSSFPGSW